MATFIPITSLSGPYALDSLMREKTPPRKVSMTNDYTTSLSSNYSSNTFYSLYTISHLTFMYTQSHNDTLIQLKPILNLLLESCTEHCELQSS